jgi:hypothetical protein
MGISCRYCGLKFDAKDSPKKTFCSNAHKMRQHRIEKKGFKLVMVERSQTDLNRRLIKLGFDGNEDKFLVHKKEHGDQLSKNCWLIYKK